MTPANLLFNLHPLIGTDPIQVNKTYSGAHESLAVGRWRDNDVGICVNCSLKIVQQIAPLSRMGVL